MQKNKKLIKIFDAGTACKLKARGFPYVEESLNKNQKLYVFKNTKKLAAALSSGEFGLVQVFEDDFLRFGGGTNGHQTATNH